MYNSEKTIMGTLKALEIQSNNSFEIIVTDDGSTDNSFKLVNTYKQNSNLDINIIRQENSGPASARNLGFKYSKGDIIIFLDSDCIPYENWVEEMIKPLNMNVAGCNCGYITKNKESIIARFVGYEIAKRHEKLIGKNIDTVGSYSASFKRTVFKDIGGFNLNYKIASGEDFDLSFKIRKMGYDLVFTDKTFVYHYHPDSLRKYLRQQFWRGYWRVVMYIRNKDKIMKGDSYTGYESQIQFILSSIMLLSIPILYILPVVTLLGISLLLISNLQLGIWAFKKEKKFIFLAPILASMRSVAGTLGVYKYFIEKVYK